MSQKIKTEVIVNRNCSKCDKETEHTKFPFQRRNGFVRYAYRCKKCNKYTLDETS